MAVAVGTMVLFAVGMVAAQTPTPSATRALDKTTVAAGESVVATITVSGAATGVVTETLPAGFTYVSSSLADRQVRPDPNNAQRIRFVVTDSADNPFTYTVTVANTGTISGTLRADRMDYSVTGGDTVTVAASTTPSATRALSTTSAAAGDSVTATITVSGTATGVVTETLPADFTYVSSSLSPSQVRPDRNNSQVIHFVLAESGDSPFTYTVTVADTGTISGNLTADRVQYSVTGDGTVTVAPSGVPTATRALSTTTVSAVGESVTATVTVNGAARGVVTETLPAGFTYVSSSLMAGQVRPDSNNPQIIRFVLAESGDNPFTYTVAVAATGTVSGNLTVDRVNYAVTGEDTVTVPTGLGPGAVRALSTTTLPTGGGSVTATITASGIGGQGVVTETLPAGFTYASSSLPAGQVRPDSNNPQVIRFVLADAADSPFTYTVTVTQTGTISGNLTKDRVNYPVSGASTVTVGAVTPPPPPPPAPVPTPAPGPVDPTVNVRPLFDEGIVQERSIAEESEAGANVGDPVLATDANGDDITYLLMGDDADAFDIDSSTGQISVGEGTVLDYETKDSYSVVVRAQDHLGAADIATVTINVTDVEEAPPTPEPTAEPTPRPTSTPAPTREPVPTVAPTPTPVPTEPPAPTATTRPTATPAPTATPEPEPTAMPEPTATTAPTAMPEPTATPEPTEAPTAAPTATTAPQPTAAPTATSVPEPEEEAGFPVVIILLIIVLAVVVAVIFFVVRRR